MDASLSPPGEADLPPAGQADLAAPGPMADWLLAARDGSQSALGRALEGMQAYLLLVAQRALDGKLQAKVGASDLVQDTFVAAQRDFKQFRGQTSEEFYAWLVGILHHRLANNVRRYRLTQGRNVDRELPREIVGPALADLRDVEVTPGTAASLREEQRRVQLALDRLDETTRSILIERTWQGATFAEIGARCSMSADAARKAWARAVREMHRQLLDIE